MPNRDGTGPRGQGAGRGQGLGGGRGMGRSGVVIGQSRSDATSNCVCPECGHKRLHKVGFPCSREICPECGTKMIRE